MLMRLFFALMHLRRPRLRAAGKFCRRHQGNRIYVVASFCCAICGIVRTLPRCAAAWRFLRRPVQEHSGPQLFLLCGHCGFHGRQRVSCFQAFLCLHSYPVQHTVRCTFDLYLEHLCTARPTQPHCVCRVCAALIFHEQVLRCAGRLCRHLRRSRLCSSGPLEELLQAVQLAPAAAPAAPAAPPPLAAALRWLLVLLLLPALPLFK